MCNTSDLIGVKALGGISYHPEPFCLIQSTGDGKIKMLTYQ